jgi:hypothetical protein
LGTIQKGLMSTSFSKKIALWFALDLWSENNPKIPVLLEI